MLVTVGQFDALVTDLHGCKRVAGPTARDEFAEVKRHSSGLRIGEVRAGLVVHLEVTKVVEVVQTIAVEVHARVFLNFFALVALDVAISPLTLWRRNEEEFSIIIFRLNSLFASRSFGVFSFLRCLARFFGLLGLDWSRLSVSLVILLARLILLNLVIFLVTSRRFLILNFTILVIVMAIFRLIVLNLISFLGILRWLVIFFRVLARLLLLYIVVRLVLNLLIVLVDIFGRLSFFLFRVRMMNALFTIFVGWLVLCVFVIG